MCRSAHVPVSTAVQKPCVPALPFWVSRPLSRILPVFLTWTLWNSPMAPWPQDPEGWVIRQGSPFQRELSAGQRHMYHLALMKNQHGRLLIDSGNTELDLLLSGPDGKVVRQSRLSLAESGETRQIVSIVADAPGDYRAELKVPSETSASLRYTLVLDELRAATDMDRTRFAAEQLFAEAHQLQLKKGVENYRLAASKYRESRPLWQKLDDHRWEGILLTNLGGVHRMLGENETALQYYLQAVPLHRQTGNRRQEAGTLNNIAAVSYSRGDALRATDYFRQSLSVAQASGDRQAESILLNNIAVTYLSFGETQTALDYLGRSLELRRSLKDRAGEVRSLNNLTLVFRVLGDFELALKTAQSAMALADELKDPQLQAPTLNTLGSVYQSMGDSTSALSHFERALPVLRQLGDRRLESATLANLGELHARQGRMDSADNILQQALTLTRSLGERQREGSVLRTLGMVSFSRQDVKQALSLFDQALILQRQIGDVEGEAATLKEASRVERASGRFTAALERAESALKLVESLRVKVANPDLRASYFSSRRAYYELYVDLLMSSGQQPQRNEAKALEASERARARSLIDLLRESHVQVRQHIDAAFVERQRRLQQEINSFETGRMRLLSSKANPQELASIQKQLDDSLAEYRQLESQIHARSPQYASLIQPEALSFPELQALLDKDTVLLEYLLAPERSYLWVLTSSSLTSHGLPGSSTVEALASRVYKLLTVRNQSEPGETPAQRRKRLRQADAQSHDAALELSRLLLGPAMTQLVGKRLLIVADGALNYMPFGALPVPGPGMEHTPLVAAHEIINLPSLSTLAALRNGPRHEFTPERTIAVLADPVFSVDDERLGSARGRSQAPSSPEASDKDQPATRDLSRSAREAGLLQFRRLRFTRQEADQIAAIVPGTARLRAVDFAASRETAVNLGAYRIVHFATHGLVNSHHPELSGLVFSLVNESGQLQEGFLRLHDVYNLRLQADLVVLSACQTALGKEIKGEGLIGLTRGFMYAGAPRVMASLWSVEDRASAELMKRFYQGALLQGLRPAAALRAAQTGLARDKRWRAPYYWAAFTLQGEWR